MIAKLINLIQNKTSRLLFYNNNIRAPIYIYDNFLYRWLCFDNTAIQSKVNKLSPHKPVLKTSRVLAFAGILYTCLPKQNSNINKLDQANNHNESHKILILGLGGGDLVRFYINLFKSSRNKTTTNDNIIIDVIEHSEEIITIAMKYFYLSSFIKHKDNKSSSKTNSKIISEISNIELNIKHNNAYTFISENSSVKYNIITVDFFTGLDSALDLLQEKYIEKLYNKLCSTNGILVINTLISKQDIYNNFISIISKYFKGNILIVSIKVHYNIVIFAFMNKSYLEFICDHSNSNIVNKYIKNMTIKDNMINANFNT